MRLLVTTPLATVVDEVDIARVRAADDSGWFGLHPGHADFVTVLRASVLSWHYADGGSGHVAVRGGVLSVSAGERVEVASREAVRGDDLEALLAEVQRETDAARRAHDEEHGRTERLHVAAVHRICRYLRAEQPAAHRILRR